MKLNGSVEGPLTPLHPEGQTVNNTQGGAHKKRMGQ